MCDWLISWRVTKVHTSSLKKLKWVIKTGTEKETLIEPPFYYSSISFFYSSILNPKLAPNDTRPKWAIPQKICYRVKYFLYFRGFTKHFYANLIAANLIDWNSILYTDCGHYLRFISWCFLLRIMPARSSLKSILIMFTT